jgi:hypothetical protein
MMLTGTSRQADVKEPGMVVFWMDLLKLPVTTSSGKKEPTDLGTVFTEKENMSPLKSGAKSHVLVVEDV